MVLVAEFLRQVVETHKTQRATEHSYRPALKTLFDGLRPGEITATNEPKRIACGAPDFILQTGDIAIGFVEAKDLGLNLRQMKDANRDQQKRYLAALPNLIYTNCLDWDFYRNGQLVASVTVADYLMGIQPKPDQYATLENLLRDFIAQRPQTITSPKVLAGIMAGKAGLIKDVLRNALKADADLQSDLGDQFKAFREHLIHDITPEDFADIYAETIAYGMFAARLHDPTLDSFSRHEALELLPKSNPFLRNLFSYIAGPNLDDRIRWIIDDLAKVFQAANMAKIMEGFGRLTGQNDPFLHFYETFLAAYNPAKRKARGVWYTPEPVVNFIVRAVDEVLQTEFGLADGLADTSKVTVDWDTGQTDSKGKPVRLKKEVHRVQILDPATGTGTFLAEVIKQIAPKVKGVAPGMWSQYVERDLIPRIHGFELLMASYAMCHMKLDMILTEMGYKPTGTPPRLSVYLTNSLEEGEPANQSLPFAQWLSNEVKQANTIKRDMPIMCVIGNPPYNNSSSNNGAWIRSKIAIYKKGLSERKINLDDDYIKFLRLAEDFVVRNGTGVIAMITNNSYLDGASHRKMRAHLLETFDSIHIVNLHGDIRNESTAESNDENVFDITQGVSIVLFVKKTKTKAKNAPAAISYAELSGKRKFKYKWLEKSTATTDMTALDAKAPLHLFLPYKENVGQGYSGGFKLSDVFGVYSSGIQTKRDKICVGSDEEAVQGIVEAFRTEDEVTLRAKYKLPKDGRDWTIQSAKKDVLQGDGKIVPFLYKPFDKRFIYYSGRTKGITAYPRREVMQHIVDHENVALIVNRQTVREYFSFAGITNIACCHGTFYLGNRGQDYCMPLYVYPDPQDLDQSRRSNLDPKFFAKIQAATTDKVQPKPNEIEVFDYIYGVLHCPAYRLAFGVNLRKDFPRIPWPASPEEFWSVSRKGASLRQLHLMEPVSIGPTPYPFMGEGDAKVDATRYDDGKIWINKTQYFSDVPKVTWELFVGGYQPAQKWLKDRKGRELSFEDVKHYQKIIKILAETDRIMKTINMALVSVE